ncbi:hypothetical protein C0Q70_12671 [Pomacea canaliculata]|uniref:C2H2-type domain-containing protein n=1 Tax=Pomacea canaliculata TaxID=400727 RepID=A0A2T7P264_POMCA|nr:hypothetical protein C0Q70_12671 [Pomacea canaliculata]
MDVPIKPFKCVLCDRAYVIDASLAAHKMIEHKEDPPHKCPVCGLAFFNASTYSTHLIKHSLDKEKDFGYECCVCSVEFPSSQGLRVHMSHHSGATIISKGKPPQKNPKFYNCDLCPSMFRDPQRLEEHKKSHDGNRPYECQFCHITFRLGSRLNVHVRRHHVSEYLTWKHYKCN